ncbi:MAG: tetratricopeptide repeat protein [Pirellulaceae bacterium]|nr:tetratricopeptide repeat protein [Pirellulaceae bacterium]
MQKSSSSLEGRFHEAAALAEAGRHDQAHAVFAQCLVADPGNGEVAAALLANLAARTPRPSLPPGSPPPAAPPEAPLSLADRLARLAADPWNVPALVSLAAAAASEGHDEAALAYLAQAQQAAPEDSELDRLRAAALARLRRYDEALAAWRRVEARQPDTPEAAQAMARLVIAKSRDKAGLPGLVAPGSPRRPRRATSGSKIAVEIARRLPIGPPGYVPDPRLTPIQRLEVAIREFPARPELYAQIVPLYLEAGRDYDAEKLLTKGKEATDGDPLVQELWEDVMMLRLEKKLASAQQRIQTENTPQTQAELADLRQARDRLATETFVNRCKREPENFELRYQLGLRLRQAGKLREACARFTEALADAEQAGPAAYALGICLVEAKEVPEALKHFRLAAEAAARAGQFEVQKESLYQAGVVALRLKLFKLARRYLAELAKLDPNHRDAPALLQTAERHAT